MKRLVFGAVYKNLSMSILIVSLIFLTGCLGTCDKCDKPAEVAAEQSLHYPGSRFAGQWNGYEKYELICDGRKCSIVLPKKPAKGNPWIWRARFFGHQPQADISLLSKGFHLVYMDVAGMYGNPEAVKHWDKFYEYLTKECGLAQKVALEGMSRGGLIVFNWATENPEKTACIYVDAPVCDFKSWPGGKGSSQVSEPDWQACLKAYNLTEEEAMAYKKNPIDNLEPLAKAQVPLLHVCGADDQVVPVRENTGIVEKRYREVGGDIQVIIKKGCGHHPHSLSDPKPIVEFIVKHTVCL